MRASISSTEWTDFGAQMGEQATYGDVAAACE